MASNYDETLTEAVTVALRERLARATAQERLEKLRILDHEIALQMPQGMTRESVDSILFAEPNSDDILVAISSNSCVISASNYLEIAIVVDSTKNPITIRKFDELIKEAEIEILPTVIAIFNLENP